MRNIRLKHFLQWKVIALICAIIGLGFAGAWSAKVCGYILFGSFSIALFVIALVVVWFDWQFRDEWEFERFQIGSPLENPGFVLKWLRYIFAYFYMIVPSKWISGTMHHQNKIDLGCLRPYVCIDIYVIGWFVMELSALIWLVIRHVVLKANVTACETVILQIAIPYLCFRLFDIFQSWVKQFILQQKWKAISVHRSLVLAFIGYFEIGIIGAIIRYTNQQPIRIWQAIDNSVMTMIVNPASKPSPIQYTQIMFSILFIVVVAQHIIGRKAS
jgi:hypothetical protein